MGSQTQTERRLDRIGDRLTVETPAFMDPVLLESRALQSFKAIPCNEGFQQAEGYKAHRIL
jgi:hypothetical protein